MSAVHEYLETTVALVERLWPAAFWWLAAAVLLAAVFDRSGNGRHRPARRD